VSISHLDEYFKGFPVTIEPLTPERRRAMTREHLLEAAAVVFARDGFHGASLDDVAARAGFTKGAVYSNFKNKEDLFLALIDHRMETAATVVTRELEATAEVGAGDQLTRIRDLIQGSFDEQESALNFEFLAYAARHPGVRAKLAARGEKQHAVVMQITEHEWKRRGAKPEYPVDVLATIMLALFDGLGTSRFINPNLVSDDTLQQALTILYKIVDGEDPAASAAPG
jgi:AcrR family transcriptional regulator